jgi:hypothetical protein
VGLREEIENYRQPDGLISPDLKPGPDSTGNGLLYFSLYHILLVRLGLSRPSDLDEFESVVRTCYVPGHVGLLRRSPTKTEEQESFDDYVAVMEAARVLNSRVRFEIYQYGFSSQRLINFIYNNLSPEAFSWKAWLGRNPALVAHFRRCLGLTPSMFGFTWHYFSIVFSSVYNDSSCLQTWLKLQAAKDDSRLMEVEAQIWEWRLERFWKQGLKSVLEHHLGSEHALARYWG